MASEILVPSCIESALSGIMRPNMTYSWFARTFEVPSSWTAGDDDDDDERGNNTNKNKNRNSRVVLNFDSVDYEATVFVNGRAAGRHVGGYFRFSLDVTDYLVAGSNTLHVHVFDPTDSAGWSVAVGKQALTPSHIFYTPCTGIWKSVWLEPVPEQYITDLNIAADMNGQVNMTVSTNEVRTRPVRVVVSDGCNGTIAVANGTTGSPFVFQATLPQLWSPDSPNLYNLTVWMGSDEVHSYTGFRTLSTGLVDGVRRPLVNGAFFFHMGALDQGYWPDGVYTPPGRDAMLSDLALLRRLGFNMVRKHMKVESDLWYRACDELGLLVVQDMPAMPSGGLPDATQQEEWERQVGMLVKQHRNFPSIYTWVIYNEGWGQLTDYYPEAAIARDIARADPTRFVDATSGWVDHGLGDWHDNHHYSSPQCGTPFYSAPDSQHSGARMAIQGEFGGIGNNVSAAHLWPVAAAVETINQTYELTATTAVWNFRAHELLGQLRAQVQRWDCSAAVWT
ncbi:glycoside hydrolase family 2 protein [Xylariaceae sp. FL0804]|nr:glycoside hydrolase family 2 protein [Xylariaceae sp. FL0804]